MGFIDKKGPEEDDFEVEEPVVIDVVPVSKSISRPPPLPSAGDDASEVTSSPDVDLEGFEDIKIDEEDHVVSDASSGVATSESVSSSMDDAVRAIMSESTSDVSASEDVVSEHVTDESDGVSPSGDDESDEVLTNAHYPEVDSDEMIQKVRDDETVVRPMSESVYRGIDDAYDIVNSLLQSGNLDADEARALSGKFFSFDKNVYSAKRLELDQRERELNELRKQQFDKERAAAAVNGGALSSLISRMFTTDPKKKFARMDESIKNDKDALALERNKFAEAIRQRLVETRRKQYSEHALLTSSKADEVARRVRFFNDTFLDCPESASFKSKLEDYSKSSGVDLADAMEKASSGALPKDVMDEYNKVKAKAFKNPSVASAYEAMMKSEEELSDYFMKSYNKVEELSRMDNMFDPEKSSEFLTKAMEDVNAKLPKPVADDPDADKKFGERLKEVAANIGELFSKLFSALTSFVKK